MRFTLILLGVTCAIVSPAQTTVDFPTCAHQRTDKPLVMSGMDPNGGVHGAAVSDTDVLHYDLNIEINPSAHTVAGSNTITVKSLVNGLTTFTVQLRSNFSVTAVQVDGLPSTWTQVNTANGRVALNHVYNAGDQFTVYVAYNGSPVSQGFGSFDFTSQNGQPLVESLSEPYYSNTWWPAKDENTDKATADLRFTVPNTMKAISNGVRISTTPVGGTKTQYYWKTNYPTATYLYCVAATNYNEFGGTYDFGTGTMPLQFFIYPTQDSAGTRSAWLKVSEMLPVLSSLYGQYPFINEKYGIYHFNFNGGMEHQTMTGEGTFLEWVTVHELGHQWWGDCVTCATWSDIWLNEGFATYTEALWEQFKPGGSEAGLHDSMAMKRPSEVSGTVYCYDTSDINRIFSGAYTYNKAAWVLHMLRSVLGDEKFFQGLGVYRAAHEYSSATTADFQAAMESAYGSTLQWFFNEWVYQGGAPVYQFAWRPVVAGGKDYVELYVKQTQNASYPFFKMPVYVKTTNNGQPVVSQVWNTAQSQSLLFAVPAPTTALTFNPGPWILATAVTSTAFVEGPPKLVKVSPSPQSEVLQTQAQDITIAFHKNVVAAATDFQLTGQVSGSIPFTFTYDAPTFTATIHPIALLPYDTYTLRVKDTLTDAVAGKKLDGELDALGTLPSGDGLAGGEAVLRFRVAKYLPQDPQIHP